MKHLLALLALAVAPACVSLTEPGGPQRAADTLELYRLDILDVAYLATPETHTALLDLSRRMETVEGLLRASDVSGAADAAEAALIVADALAQALAPESDLRFYVALAKIALRHVRAGEPGDVVPPDEVPPAELAE